MFSVAPTVAETLNKWALNVIEHQVLTKFYVPP